MDGGRVVTLSLEALIQDFARAAGRSGPQALDPLEIDFLRQALEDYVDDETPELSPEDLAGALAELWRFGEVRAGGAEPLIRLRHGEGMGGKRLAYDFLEIIQDDAPFLVDSIMGELGEQGVSVRALFHPVLSLDRFGPGHRRPQAQGSIKESTILVVIDPVAEDRRAQIMEAVLQALQDVHTAVRDFRPMREQMGRAIASLTQGPSGPDPEVAAEAVAFLNWLLDDHFVFLGSRTYSFPIDPSGSYEPEEPLPQAEQALGVLKDPERAVLRRAHEPAVLTRQLQRRLDLAEPVVVAKSNLTSRVHRRTRMDYIGVRRFSPDGRPNGEVRFVGLFTAEAYDQVASDVPLVRRKVARVLERAGKAPGSHNAKRLRNILENYPRDELFQTDEDDLLRIALGVGHLFDRPRIKIFTRRDPFDRFASVLLYVPRDRYDAGLRERAGRIIAQAWGGRLSAWYPQLTDAPLVRVHYIIGFTPGEHPEPVEADVEAAVIEAARTWEDRFISAARDGGMAEAELGPLADYWAEAFPVAYRERYPVPEALLDLSQASALERDGLGIRAFRDPSDGPLRFRFKIYRHGAAIPLADVLPVLEAMGLKAMEEWGFTLQPEGDGAIFVHEFLVEDPRGADLDFAAVRGPFEEAFRAVWTGETESDGFNRLVFELAMPWRQAALIRALCRYRLQSGLDPSQAVQEAALRDHPEVTRLILDLFAAKFDPDRPGDAEARKDEAQRLVDAIGTALQQVASLDQDRALRRLGLLVQAATRTNFYQRAADGGAKPYISFKVASQTLADLPAPKPYREIFVWAPHVEGVHLRFGPVARGGLRWSDRREDFRTEVLGLVKAQQVKNAVIVPVGSKGGFFPKHLPRGGTPDAVRAEGVRAYKTFLAGLLDITDNLDAAGAVVRPDRVVAWEGDDPYLVVAADKGTATFSDIANGVSADYGFWLGDAFASGGSQGYDHKAMGITARGAWEAVKRHFREIGKDIQSEPFSVVGVGDMSGDVFGNGMLLSPVIRLVAAFDHRDIFLDPDPDPAKSFAERRRLFDLPRSSWQDYDKSLISEGGGVYSRSLKSIPLSSRIRALLGVNEAELAPADLMRAILKAPCELLYFGGIGTYIKSQSESHLSVGDKANDAIRVDAGELRCQVVGEGANLGVTQQGRIAFARLGGRINSDAIDNSAGVDTSDHEVNIKILTGALEAQGRMGREERNALLASMTDQVARHVLAHNYDQTLAISLQQAASVADLDAHTRFMARLEQAGRLDRVVETLPSPAALAELAASGQGLTRPEIAVLTAYGKIELTEDITASRAPEDTCFEETLKRYFPEPLRVFEADMRRHRLRREIIATVVANQIVNMTGPTFPQRLKASVGCDTTAFVIAFEAARRVFRLDEAWDAVSALDLKIPAKAQLALYEEISTVLRRQTYWLARRAARGAPTVEALSDAYRPAADALRSEGAGLLSEFEQAAVARRAESFMGAGAPAGLSAAVAVLRPLTAVSDVADLANRVGWPIVAAGRFYNQIGAVFGFDRLRAAAGGLNAREHYERLAVRRLIEDLLAEQSAMADAVARTTTAEAGAGPTEALDAIRTWASGRATMIAQARRTVEEIEQSGTGWSFAKLTIAAAALRELASSR